jgi:hypothetical protein
MSIDDRGTSPSATWILLRRRRATVVRSVLLSAAVFTLAALTGAVLASAAPARPAEPEPGHVATSPVHAYAYDPDFARSMVFSGTAALTLSVAGIVMIGRRRRSW